MTSPFRKVLAVGAVASLVLTAAACSNDEPSKDSDKETFKIGVTQIVAHPSLDISIEGFKDALKEAGIEAEYDSQNAAGEISNTASIASVFASDSDIDLVLAVSTPSAQAVVGAITDKPVVFSAVTDPVAAELVPSWDPSGTNVTGVSDLNPDAKPAELIKQIVPDVKTIGVLYSSSEANSKVQLDAITEEAAALGIEVKPSAITAANEVAAGAQALADVDAIYLPTDNTVVSALDVLIDFANSNQIPIISADGESVAKGTVATRGVDYYELGKRSGELAARILKGEKPGEIATVVVTDTEVIYNEAAAAAQGVALSDEFKAQGRSYDAE